jgi:hypothetical protein
MPYIKQELRDEIRHGKPPLDAGELNYCITKLIHSYWDRFKNYQGANDVMGALEGAKLEFYRRKVAPYEDRKITENGDV